MAKLYNTIERVASMEQIGVVVIDLLWDGDDAAGPTNASEKRSINGPIKISTDQDGYWEVDDIDPNTEITPTDNIYVVSEYADNERIDHYVNITTNGTYWLGDVIVTKPIWIEDQ